MEGGLNPLNHLANYAKFIETNKKNKEDLLPVFPPDPKVDHNPNLKANPNPKPNPNSKYPDVK